MDICVIRKIVAFSLIGILVLPADLDARAFLGLGMEIENAFQGQNGATFISYEEPERLELVIRLTNEECQDSNCRPNEIQEILFPVDIDSRIQIGMTRNNEEFPIRTVREKPLIGRYFSEKPVPQNKPVLLKPGESLFLKAMIYPAKQETRFVEAQYAIHVDMKGLAGKITLTDRKTPWLGYYQSKEGLIRIAVHKAPRTKDEQRLIRVTEGRNALRKGDAQKALRLFNEVHQNDLSDLWIHADLGETYLELGQFREAIREFEIVLPYSTGKSMLPDRLAMAYMAIGENEKAALLTNETSRAALRKTIKYRWPNIQLR